MGAEKAALEALREIYVANSSSFPPNTLVLVKDALAAKEEYKVRFCLPSLHRSLPPSLLFGMQEGSHLNDLKTDRSLHPSLPPSLLPPPFSQKEVKNVMKFAALRQHEVKTLGADALEDSLAYDQKAILETSLDYITKSLGKNGGGREGGRERGRVWNMLGPDAHEDSLFMTRRPSWRPI